MLGDVVGGGVGARYRPVVVRRSLEGMRDTVAGRSDRQQTHSAILESTVLCAGEIMQCGKRTGSSIA